MKWLVVAAILLWVAVGIWVRLFPRSATARMLGRSRRRRSDLLTMPIGRLLWGGAAFLSFGAVCAVAYLGLRFAATEHGWPGLDSSFFGALAGSLVAVGGLAALGGFVLLLWAMLKSVF